MKKLVVMSDNHGSWYHVDYIKEVEKDIDYYIHCGDSVSDDAYLKGWIAVRGNSDYRSNLPLEASFEVEGVKIGVLHGHQFGYMLSIDLLFEYMKDHDYDLLFFGHVHRKVYEQEDGRVVINPGSTARSRSGSESYAIVTIDQGKISVEFKEM